MKHLLLITLALLLFGCGTGSDMYPNLNVGDFGAFHTRIDSGEPFEEYARVREHPDIVVDIGRGSMTLNFWRGSSYLPYLETPKGRWYVEELVERRGDGEGMMPDQTNTFSHVRIIKNTEEEVVVHWRYLPVFEGGNPKSGAAPYKFVDEYYYINPKGEVKRTLQKGTERTDDWKEKASVRVQTFRLSRNGIRNAVMHVEENETDIAGITGIPTIETRHRPQLWWKFDEGQSNHTRESKGGTVSEVAGHKTLWRKGVSGTALQFDGYYSEVRMPAEQAPAISEALTLEGWVALGAYPWSDVPLIQQLDDEPEERIGTDGRRGTKDFHFVFKEEQDKGYFLGIDGFGKPLFKIHIDGKLQHVKADLVLERRQWYHLAATYDSNTGLMRLFVNGKNEAQKQVGRSGIVQSDNDIRIGKGKDRRPIRPVRNNTFPGTFSIDGLIDEVKVYDIPLSEQELQANYEAYQSNASHFAAVDMDQRVLPEGENRKEFGAYYTRLKFYDVWDNLWRFGEHPDVVVEFDNNPNKFIFWRGTSYIPMMVNDKGQWYSNEFNETWGTSGGAGCQEPMSDKKSFMNHVRVLENTPARTVVHWRYPLVNVDLILANYNDSTGWGDWSDWYFYIYPDGIAVKSKKLWTHGNRNHEWQESMAIFGPDQHPENIIDTRETLTMVNLKGETVTYNWVNNPPPNVREPEGQCIQIVNYTGRYKPVTIGNYTRSSVYGGELTEYSVFPTWNHWPVAQMPSDGRYATYPDRSAHSSLTHLVPEVFDEELSGPKPFYKKLIMEAMLDWDTDELIILARSWLNPPNILNLHGAEGAYAPNQRAYVLAKQKGDISFTIDASDESPLLNLAVVVKNWNSTREAKVMVDGSPIKSKQGTFRDTDGTNTLSLWIELKKQTTTNIMIQ